MKRVFLPPIQIQIPNVSPPCVGVQCLCCVSLASCVCAGFYICTKFQLLNECNGILFVVLYSVSFATMVFYFWLRATQKLRCRLGRRCFFAHNSIHSIVVNHTHAHRLLCAPRFHPFYKTSALFF